MKKVAVIFTLIVFISILILWYFTKKQPITTTGVIELGTIEANSGYTAITLLKTSTTTYAITDNLSEETRTRMKNNLCPDEGRLVCYAGKNIQVKGFLTNRYTIGKLRPFTLRYPAETNSTPTPSEALRAQSIEIYDFKIVNDNQSK